MKMAKGIMAFIVLVTCITVTAMNKKGKKAIRRSAERILNSKHCSHPDKEQTKLLESFKEHEDIQSEIFYPDDLSLLVSALSAQTTLPLLRDHEETLHTANSLFYHIPGYVDFLKRICASDNEAHIRGALYELKLALDITQKDDGEEVIEFGKKIMHTHNGQPATEIDVVTNKRWLEGKLRSCKGKSLHDLKTQLQRQKNIADSYNQNAGAPIDYEVHFQSVDNDNFKAWMQEHHIKYVIHH